MFDSGALPCGGSDVRLYDMDNGVLMNKSMEKVVLTCKTEVSVCPSVIVTVGT